MPHLRHALDSLTGLSVGDAFGARILLPGDHPTIRARELPTGTWTWTDDTEMACSVLAVLAARGEVDPDALAQLFAGHFDPDRGYGPGVERQLLAIRRGEPWQLVSTAAFGGTGSWGNGAAMRVAPLGAYFHDDLPRVVAEAHKSAIVTHAHPEGIAGALAVAVAAALAASTTLTGSSLLAAVAPHLPDSQVRDGIELATNLVHGDLSDVASQLGTGARTSGPDTVPLSLWIAANHMSVFEEAMWTVAAVASDVDTVAAIVGGVIAARTSVVGIPEHWRVTTEPLPDWVPR
jgi:ADP-ribosylglycohydrolase